MVTATLHSVPVGICREVIKDIAENLGKFKEIMKRLFFYENTEGQKVTVSSKTMYHFPLFGIYGHDVNYDDF